MYSIKLKKYSISPSFLHFQNGENRAKKSSDDKKIGDLDKKNGNSRISRQILDMYDF